MHGRSTKAVRYPGLSKVAVRHGATHTGQRQTEILKAGKQQERRAANQKRRRDEIQAMSYEERALVQRMDIDGDLTAADVDSVACYAPPGEEGADISHEGGEFEIFQDIVEGLAQSTGYKRVDARTRRDRIEIMISQWDVQMDKLANAYLESRMHDRGDGMPKTPELPEKPNTALAIPVFLLDTNYQRQVVFQPFLGDTFPNETLLRHGYLGCSPVHPNVAISVRTLAAYQQCHRTNPRFSIEAQCKAFCHLHKVPYLPYLATQFSVAYDAYLEICRQVDLRINERLGYNTPNSWLLRSCPACFYKLQGEPELEFSCLVSMDGNNSLKRLGASVRAHDNRPDPRKIASDRWLTPDEVDLFKDEVKSGSQTAKPDADPTDDWEDINDDQATGGLKCVDRWRNAGPEERKKMFAMFDESGIFVATCRHRMTLLVCDMIRSGELAKYPLAMVDRLINILGNDIGCAYDIGCAFSTTVENSSLSLKAKAAHFRLMVGAFHGHAHNRSCQLQWHPAYITGTGNTEGEGCEHVFSSSNDLARGTRHATRFHRQQAIEEHFSFWDEDKYANLSQFLLNHYREALNTISVLEIELSAVNAQLGITNDDFKLYLNQEREYLRELREPSPVITLKGQYVKGLNDLFQAQQEWISAREAAMSVFNKVAPANLDSALLTARHRTDVAFEKLQNAQSQVGDIEVLLGVDMNSRWTKETPEYKDFYQQTVITSYSKALDDLERLVVMRLFELAKMSTSGTGYKLRRQIGKGLQRRSEAIRSALGRYNTQAARLDPPRPPLTWKEIVDYSFLAEFDLLRHSRADIRKEKWAEPAHREATVKYFKLCRSREEITRLNVEIRRLRTSIHYETSHIEQVITELSTSDPPLAVELSHRWTLRNAINKIHLQRLRQIKTLPGFSGAQGLGVPLDSVAHVYGVSELQKKMINRNAMPVPSVDDDGTALPNYRVLIDDDDEAGEDGDAELARLTDFFITIKD